MERIQTTRNVWTKWAAGRCSRLGHEALRSYSPALPDAVVEAKGGKRSFNDPISNRWYLAYTNLYFTKMPLKPKMPIKNT